MIAEVRGQGAIGAPWPLQFSVDTGQRTWTVFSPDGECLFWANLMRPGRVLITPAIRKQAISGVPSRC